MFNLGMRRLAVRLTVARRRPDRGAETIEVMMWVGVILAVVVIAGAIFRDDVRDYFNSLVYDIGF
jgi:multisubunit Na+/H+ antiporter MnhB subunit